MATIRFQTGAVFFSGCNKSSRQQKKQTDGSALCRYGHSNTNISVTAQLEYFMNFQRTYPSTTASAAELLMKDQIPAQWLFRTGQIDYKFSDDIFNIHQVLCCSKTANNAKDFATPLSLVS